MLEYLAIIIPACISILGFVISYFFTKNTFKEELQKQKNSIHLEEMADVPYEVLKFVDNMLYNKNKKNYSTSILEDMKKLISRIYAYGSEDALTILSAMQQYTYNSVENPQVDFKGMAYYLLLASQIKYDVTGIAISPMYWYKLKLTDYKKQKDNLIDLNNAIVKELGLKSDFLIRP